MQVGAEPGRSRSTVIRRRIVALAVLSALLVGGLLTRTDRVVRADGRLAPKWWAQIRADGPGEVRARLKRQGDPVRANEAVALLELEGDEAAVTAAEGDLAAARQQFKAVARQLNRMADYSVVVPPPSVLDLGAWLQEEVKNRAPRALLVAGATERMQSIRTELQARAGRLPRATSGSRPPEPVSRRLGGAIETLLARGEEQILDALRLPLSKGSSLSLDQAVARYEDAIFEGLCDVAGVLPPVVRDAFAAGGPVAALGEPGQVQGAAGLRTPEGYFELQSQLRRTQLELRQLETEAANLARLREVLPALTGARHGELKALRQALEELVARSQESRRQRDDGLGPDGAGGGRGGRLRTEIHGTGEALLEGVDWAWASAAA